MCMKHQNDTLLCAFKLVENRIRMNAKAQGCLEAESEYLRKRGKAGHGFVFGPKKWKYETIFIAVGMHE